jgi:hypothetical protein
MLMDDSCSEDKESHLITFMMLIYISNRQKSIWPYFSALMTLPVATGTTASKIRLV